VALSRIISPISCDVADLLIRRDLIEQIEQYRGVTHIASGHLNGTDIQRLLINPDVLEI